VACLWSCISLWGWNSALIVNTTQSVVVVGKTFTKEMLQEIFTGILRDCTGRTTTTELMENVDTWQKLVDLHSEEHVREALGTFGTFAVLSSWKEARKQLTRPRGYVSSTSSASSAKPPSPLAATTIMIKATWMTLQLWMTGSH